MIRTRNLWNIISLEVTKKKKSKNFSCCLWLKRKRIMGSTYLLHHLPWYSHKASHCEHKLPVSSDALSIPAFMISKFSSLYRKKFHLIFTSIKWLKGFDLQLSKFTIDLFKWNWGVRLLLLTIIKLKNRCCKREQSQKKRRNFRRHVHVQWYRPFS